MARALLLLGVVFFGASGCVLPPPPAEEPEDPEVLIVEPLKATPPVSMVVKLERNVENGQQTFSVEPAVKPIGARYPNVYWYIDWKGKTDLWDALRRTTYTLCACDQTWAGDKGTKTLLVEALITYGEIIYGEGPNPDDWRQTKEGEPIASVSWSIEVSGNQQCEDFPGCPED